MLAGTHHVSFTVAIMERSLAFYRDLLGCEVTFDYNGTAPYLATVVGYPDAHLHIVFLKLPGTDVRLELIEYLEPRGTPRPLETKDPGTAHICLRVSGIHELYERYLASGVRFKSPPVEITTGPNQGAFAVYFVDPDGITLEMIQPPPGR